MKKYAFALAIFAFFHLEAAQFQHKVLITLTESPAAQPKYLAQFNIDKIMGENTAPDTISSPKLVCIEGHESVFEVGEAGDGVTIKALVYKQGDQTKAKTSIIVQEDNETVYAVNEEFDVD